MVFHLHLPNRLESIKKTIKLSSILLSRFWLNDSLPEKFHLTKSFKINQIIKLIRLIFSFNLLFERLLKILDSQSVRFFSSCTRLRSLTFYAIPHYLPLLILSNLLESNCLSATLIWQIFLILSIILTQ